MTKFFSVIQNFSFFHTVRWFDEISCNFLFCLIFSVKLMTQFRCIFSSRNIFKYLGISDFFRFFYINYEAPKCPKWNEFQASAVNQVFQACPFKASSSFPIFYINRKSNLPFTFSSLFPSTSKSLRNPK